MAQQAEIIDRVVELIHTTVPAENLSQAMVPAIVCVVGGGVLMLWGAKVIRTLIVIACTAGGAYAGWLTAHQLAQPPALGVLAGGAVLGVIGLLAVRLWIAALSGLLAGVVALSIYGYHQDLLGRFEQFDRSSRRPAPTADNEFPLADAGTAEALASQKPLQVIRRFVGHLRQADDALLSNTILWVGGAGLVGTAIGLLAYRWAMIFWTSLAGLILIAGGGVVLLEELWPRWHDSVAPNASGVGLGALAVWLTGLFVQWRGTRRGRMPTAKPAGSAASAATST